MAEDKAEKKAEATGNSAATNAAPEAPNQTSAEAKLKTSKGEHTVNVSKTIHKNNEEEIVVSQAVSHEFKGKGEASREQEVKIDTYNTNDGHSTQTATFSSNYTYDKKGNWKKVVEVEKTHTTNAQDGAVGIASGSAKPVEYGSENTTVTTYDKNQGVSSVRRNQTVQTTQGNSRTDEYSEYKNGELERTMRVQANAAGYTIKAIEANKKEFTASVSNDGSARYIRSEKNKTTQVSVSAEGQVSGERLTMDGNGENVVKTEELSRKELKKELKSMRKEADETLEKVRSAKTDKERLDAIPPANKIGQAKFVAIWEVDGKAVSEAQPEARAKQQQMAQQNVSVGVNQILQNKMQEIR